MLKWVAVVLGALFAWGAYRNIRYVRLPRRRLERVLSKLGVDFVRVDTAGSYGWPGYRVLFPSLEKSSAFGESPAFETLLREVQAMHANLKYGEARFDATAAVSVAPVKLPAV